MIKMFSSGQRRCHVGMSTELHWLFNSLEMSANHRSCFVDIGMYVCMLCDCLLLTSIHAFLDPSSLLS